MARPVVAPVDLSALTSAPPTDALIAFDAVSPEGLRLHDRGEYYRVLTASHRRGVPTGVCVTAVAAIAILALLLSAVAVPWVLLLLGAPLALLPLLFHGPEQLSVSAVSNQFGITRVVVQGWVAPALLASLEAYTGSLPAPATPAPQTDAITPGANPDPAASHAPVAAPSG